MADRVLRAVLALAAALLAASCAAIPSDALRARFEAANGAYERGEWEAAADGYRELVRAGAGAPAVHYNLGNALFKTGRLAEAILAYERAARLAPRDPDVRDNLDYLRSLTVDRITPAGDPLAALGITMLLDLTSPDLDAAVFAAGWLLAGVAAAAALLARRGGARRAAIWTAAIVLAPAILAGSSLAAKSWVTASRAEAIVLADEVPVLSGAGEENPVLFTIHAGLKVRLRGRAEGWAQVSLENGLTGWVPESAVERI